MSNLEQVELSRLIWIVGVGGQFSMSIVRP